MFKRFAIFYFLLMQVMAPSLVEAKVKKKKKSGNAHSLHIYRPSKHARKSRKFHHHSSGPDLKAITTESPYTEDPSNGVTPIETKQPGP